MSIAQQLIAEFDHESATTRRVIERLPESKLGWRPHPTAMSLGQLGLHVARTPAGVAMMASGDTCEAPGFGENPEAVDLREISAAHEQSIVAFRDAVLAMDDAKLMSLWTMMREGEPIWQVPRIVFLRSVGMNHIYHHRGQLATYLRMLGVPVPSIYGASLDENPFMGKVVAAAAAQAA